MLHASPRASAKHQAGPAWHVAQRPAPPERCAVRCLAERARARGLTHLAELLDETAEILAEMPGAPQAPTAAALARQPRGGLHRLTYVSRAIGDWGEPGADQCDAILGMARARNAAEGITGALVHSHAWFGQVLEGGMADIERTFGRIARDQRHTDIRILEITEIERRGFGAWAMAEAGSAPDAMLDHAACVHERLHGASSTALRQAARDIVAVLCHRVAAH